MITVTLSIDGAAVTIQQQDDDLKALRAVLERLEATLERRDQHQRIKELETLNTNQRTSILKLMGELEEAGQEIARLHDELNRTMEHGFDVNAGRDRMVHLRAIEQAAEPLRQRIEELEHEVARLRGELDFTREHGAKLMSELEETELECGEWRREVFALGEALGLGSKWTTQEALAAIEAPKSTIAAVRSVLEEADHLKAFDTSPEYRGLVMHLRAALGGET